MLKRWASRIASLPARYCRIGAAAAQRLARILDATPVAILETDASGTITFANRAATEILRRPTAEVEGRRYDAPEWDSRAPDGTPIAPDDLPVARALRGETVLDFEHTVAGPKEPMFVLVSSVPVRDQGGHIIGTTSSMLDLTARRRAEAALREAEAWRNLAVEAADLGTWHWDLRTGDLIWSERCKAIFGIPPGEAMTYDRFLAALHPGDRSRVAAAVRRALDEGTEYDVEMRVRPPDGPTRWVRSKGRTERDRGGALAWMQGVAIDCEVRKRAEQEARASEGRLRVALEAGGLGTWEADLATGRGWWDARLARMLGLPPEPVEVDAARPAELIHPEDRERVLEEFRAAMRSGQPFVSEFRGRTGAGETRWFVAHGRLLPGKGRRGRAVGVLRDVTERRRREETLREALDARELLLREADHRIKNSLQLVVSLLTLQRARLSDAEAAEALGDAISRVNAVAQAHLALQRSKDLRHIASGPMLKELCTRLGTLNPAVAIRCGFDGELELEAERAIPLGLIVSELVTNALRHAYPSGGGTVSVDAVVVGEVLTVTVADQGTGMPMNVDSAGLGTTVVHSLAQRISAEVAVRSTPNEGTTVVLRLPLGSHTEPRR